MRKLIDEAISKTMLKHLNEAKDKQDVSIRKVNKLVNKIKGDISDLVEMLESMGIDQSCKPYKQLDRMYDIMAGLDPVHKKLAPHFKQKTETAAQGIVQSEADIKIAQDSDNDTKDTALDMAKQNNMDIQLSTDEEA